MVSVQLATHMFLVLTKRNEMEYVIVCCVVFQDPMLNICELKEIHSEINLTVPDPILLSDLHDGLEAVRTEIYIFESTLFITYVKCLRPSGL